MSGCILATYLTSSVHIVEVCDHAEGAPACDHAEGAPACQSSQGAVGCSDDNRQLRAQNDKLAARCKQMDLELKKQKEVVDIAKTHHRCARRR